MSDFFNHFFSQFHFLHPWWLLGLIPLGWLWQGLWKMRGDQGSAWQKLIDPQLLPYLLVKDDAGTRPHALLYLLGAGWLLATLALADPVWQQLPQPVYQQPNAQVIVLDLSPSMLAQDAPPSRLEQARFKIEDLLRNSRGNQTGLVAYSGDAFTVTPLTTDMATLQSQLRVLEPSLMPLAGNDPARGLQQAGDLLKQAGLRHGHIILLADDAGNAAAEAGQLAKQGYQVSVLGIGTATGAPIPGMHDKNGKPVMSHMDNAALQAIAKAGNGQFAAYTSNLQDVNSILAADHQNSLTRATTAAQDKVAQRWVENGPWLAILLLPLAALAFRRGWLLALAFITVGQFAVPQPVMASTWTDLWQRSDQQAASALLDKDYAQAATLAPDAAQRGAAEYLAGDYTEAARSFRQQDNSPAADYNLGNALAQTGKYGDAIKAYDQALKAEPTMQDAEHNRKLVENLLKKQQEQQKQQDQKNQQQAGKDQNQDQKNQQQAGKDQNQDQKNQQQAGKDQNQDQKNQQQQDQQQARQKPANGQSGQTGDKQQQQQAEQAVSDAAQAAKDQEQPRDKQPARQTAADTDKLNPEQRQAVENWLRRVPDDPGGLLRRKFLYQYQQRRQQAAQL